MSLTNLSIEEDISDSLYDSLFFSDKLVFFVKGKPSKLLVRYNDLFKNLNNLLLSNLFCYS